MKSKRRGIKRGLRGPGGTGDKKICVVLAIIELVCLAAPVFGILGGFYWEAMWATRLARSDDQNGGDPKLDERRRTVDAINNVSGPPRCSH